MSQKYKREAYTGLLHHYRDVFRHAWANRMEQDSERFKRHEAEFLPSALSIQESPVSPVSRLLAKVLIVLVAILLIWSIVGKLDIIVNAAGKVIPSERTKAIGSTEVARVNALYVKDGQAVTAGEVLVALDSSVRMPRVKRQRMMRWLAIYHGEIAGADRCG